MKLIIGLGNPGSQYDNTYHNVGFRAVDAVAAEIGAAFTKKECKALSAHALIDGEKVIVIKPQTFMNLSGESVQEFIHRYKLKTSDAIIVYDDVDLAVGEIRIRKKGSGGTHNGMRNIVLLNGEEIPRVRIGIGKPQYGQLADYVLGRIQGDHLVKIEDAVTRVKDALIDFGAGDDLDVIGCKYNGC